MQGNGRMYLSVFDGKVATHVAIGHVGSDALVNGHARLQHARQLRLIAVPQRHNCRALRLHQLQRLCYLLMTYSQGQHV